MKAVTVFPPQIAQQFSRMLLFAPTPKLRDSYECIKTMLQEAEKLWYKLRNDPKKLVRCEELKKEILELYERAKVKEKEREGQKNHKTQGFGYFVDKPTQLGRDIYYRLRFGRKSGAYRYEFGKYNAISKVRGKRK